MLHAGAMPLVRYRIGDLGTAGHNHNCGCGRGFDLMETIEGRDTDIILTPAGNRVIVHFFAGILEYLPQIDSFQVVQEEIDTVLLRIAPADGFSHKVTAEAVRMLHERGIDEAMKKELDLVGEIPLPPTGKRRFIINKLLQKQGEISRT